MSRSHCLSYSRRKSLKFNLISLNSATGHPGLLQHGHGGARGQQRDSEMCCPWLPHSSDNVAARGKRSHHPGERGTR